MSSFIYFIYFNLNTKHPSLWEGSGIEATPEQQKEIPPITAEETATGASEGQVVETIYAAISVDTQLLLLGPTPQPTPAPVEQTGTSTSATTQSEGAQTTQAATNTQAAATQAAATQPAQTTQAATQAAATQAAATTTATEAQTTTTAGKSVFQFVVCLHTIPFLLSFLYLIMGSLTYDSSLLS